MLEVKYVRRAELPSDHCWALVERGGTTTALVVDGAAEKVARAVYSNSRNRPSDSNASAILDSSADW